MLAKPLHSGSIIDLVAPAGPFDRARFETGVALLREAGFVPRFDPSIFEKERYLAGHDARRLAELKRAIEATDSDAIWCARGGFGTTRLLADLDVDAIRRANKLLIGFSDITALHALWATAGVPSIHGPMVTRLPLEAPSVRERLLRWTQQSVVDDVLAGRGLVQGTATGRLGGGNLALLAALCGTPSQPSFDGAIVFLEDIGERPYRIDRMLTQCLQSGLFNGAQGLAFGDFSDCDETDGSITTAPVLRAFATALGLPAIEGVPSGHGAVNEPLPFGLHATIDGATGTLTLRGRLTALPSAPSRDLG